jgi:hypothetical protein
MLALRSDDLSEQEARSAIADLASLVARRLGWPAGDSCEPR